MDSGTALLFSFFFGTIGLSYFIYGKKQHKLVPMLTGIALGLFPYFISSIYAMVIVGVILMALPFKIKG